GVKIAAATDSAPDDHLASSPHCRVLNPASRRVGQAGGCPTVGAGIVSATGVKIAAAASASTPDDHFAPGPDCCVRGPGGWRVGQAGGCPTVGGGIVSPAGVKLAAGVTSAPDGHFSAGPRRGVTAAGRGAGGGPRP